MAKKVKFLTKCPGCGDDHFGVECPKPTFATPTMVNVFCDNCESTVLVKVTLPRNRTSKAQVAFQTIKMAVSKKLAKMVEFRKQLEEMQSEQPESI